MNLTPFSLLHKLYKLSLLCLTLSTPCVGAFFATSSWAACVIGTSVTTVRATGSSMPTVFKIPTSVKVGEAFDSALITAPSGAQYDCREDAPRPFTTRVQIGTGRSAGFPNVCETNIPGVGISVVGDGSQYVWNVANIRSFSESNLIFVPIWDCLSEQSVSATNKILLRANNFNSSGGGFWVKLVKTSETPSTGTFSLGNIVSVTAAGYQLMQISQPGSTTVTVVNDAKCQVVAGQTVVNVVMGKVDVQAIKAGQAPDVAFNIPLNCDAGAKTLLSVAMSQTTPSGLLALQNTTNSATGVGIALSHQGSLVSSGQKISLASFNPSGLFNVPFSARYTAIDNQIQAGLANASVTFTLEQP